MIQITKGQTNTVVLTLKEKSTIDTNYYLFEFEADETKDKFYCVGTDLSDYKTRYQKFTITEKSNPTEENGEVELSLEGFYKYTIREQASSTNLDPSLSGGIVEIGKVQVIGTAQTNNTYSSSLTNYVYNE